MEERRKGIKEFTNGMALLDQKIESEAKLNVAYREADLHKWEKLDVKIDMLIEKISVKIDSLIEKFMALPCKERTVITSSLQTQVRFLWGVIVLILAAIIVEWVKK